MARWAAFLGLTGVALTLFLGLARLSQGAVRDPTPRLPAGDSGTGVEADRPARGDDPAPAPDAGDRDSDGAVGAVDADADPAPVGETRPDADPGVTSVDAGGGNRPGPERLSTGALLANVVLTQGLFGLLLAGGALYFGIPASAFGLGTESLLALALGVGLGLALWVGNELAATLADAVGATYDEGLREMLAPDSSAGWVALFALVLPVVAVVEEFVFRAAVIGVPSAGFGMPAWALVPVSAGAFALGHGAQGRVGVAVTGGLGLVLAGAYAATGSLLAVVVAHYLVNALEFLVHELLDRPRLWTS